jgi:hypothetical protein
MNSSILRSAVAAVAILGATAAAHAAILDLTLVANGAATGGAGTYGVYASVDNSSGFQSTGLASYQITLKTTTLGGPISTISNFSPKLTFTDSSGTNSDDPVGFTLLRSANSITTGNPITGSEDTVTPAQTFIYGFGLTAGNLASAQPAAGYDGTSGATQATYGAPVLLAKGLFTGTPNSSVATWFGTPTTGNVFIDNNGNTSAPNSVVLAVSGVSTVPEPASLGVLALGGMALMARRRKA